MAVVVLDDGHRALLLYVLARARLGLDVLKRLDDLAPSGEAPPRDDLAWLIISRNKVSGLYFLLTIRSGNWAAAPIGASWYLCLKN